MKRLSFLAFIPLAAFFLAAAEAADEVKPSYTSFRDIPGITEEEIQAVEKTLAGRKSLVYGMLESSECFYQEDGSLDGHAALLTQWLSELFGVPFQLNIYSWEDLANGIRSGDIDLTGDYTPDGPRAQDYVMSRPFTERAIKFVARSTDLPFANPASRASLRVAFLRRSTAHSLVMPYLRKQYGDRLSVVLLDTRRKVADMLRREELDVFITDGSRAGILMGEADVTVGVFRPLLYKRVSLATTKPELSPIIDVVNRILSDRKSMTHVHDLHRRGEKRFYRKVFVNSLNKAERDYYDKRIRAGIPIPIGTSPTNYPVEFYNESEERWDGIAFDILSEISEITGLAFRPVEFAKDNWPLLLKMLRSGDPDAPMLLDVGYNETRARDFLFADKAYLLDHYALISKDKLRNLRHDEVLSRRVGLLQDSMFSEVFRQWFPSHADTVHFSSQYEEFEALEQGRIDLLMLSQLHFSYITNFLKRTNFKINMVFEEPLRSGFGFGKEHGELRGVISKAQDLVDTQSIVRRWEYSIFDYRSEDARTRAILLTSSSVFMLLVIALLALLLFQRRREGKRLRLQVAERTRELAEQMKVTESASEAKSQFLTRMSHDMRIPLNAIIGLSGLILSEGRDTAERRNVEKVRDAGLTLLALANDLLDISKIEAGRFELSPVEYDTPSLINDISVMNVVRRGSKSISFRITVDETLPGRLRGDDLRVRQIFNNLLSNAFKYTEGGEVEWWLSWERAVGDSIWLVSSVRDTGIGIRAENLERIFTDYNQVETDSSRHIEGTGLGLPIALNLVKLMDGELTVESAYGKGSTFFVRIRQDTVGAESIGPELAWEIQQFQRTVRERPDHSRIAYPCLDYARVLVVDDVESNLDVAMGMMKPYGMRIDCVTSGQQAVELVRAERVRYDAILMDHMMPGMNGVEALQRIRAIGTPYARSVPIIAMTANVISGNEQRFLEKGFQAFLAKPVDMLRLDAIIGRFVRDEAREKAETSAPDGRARPAVDQGNDGNDGAKTPPAALLQNANIPGLDVGCALERLSGDAEAYRQALESYVRHTPGLLEKARAVSEDGLDGYIVAIHAVRGSSRSIGAETIGRKAAELEAAARNGDFTFIAEHNFVWIGRVERMLADLSKLLAQIADEMEKPLKDAPDAATLARLKTACAAYDMDGVDRAMAELEAFRYRERQEFIIWLREQARAMELQGMAEELAKREAEDG
ncbi:MAG: transporter substrate-binding domain-containing protein [Candidatus Accumulibacter sp.]|jgi:signal transduction histidine kinase/FixJ family two-component response regulator/HPt (histidine-containing phosphotransfer) domain-containing protein|nr:transporter substrate-binding domain-containing protein [Accumulibacter sp.]